MVIILKNYDRNDENYVYYYVGKNIRKYRRMRGWTQEQLAEKSNYSKQFISNIENDTHQTFSLGTLWKIALILDVSIDELVKEEQVSRISEHV